MLRDCVGNTQALDHCVCASNKAVCALIVCCYVRSAALRLCLRSKLSVAEPLAGAHAIAPSNVRAHGFCGLLPMVPLLPLLMASHKFPLTVPLPASSIADAASTTAGSSSSGSGAAV
eukprot:6567-Heterococcus_DN1.PRE.8